MTFPILDIEKSSVEKYLSNMDQDSNHRYKSWEYCYTAYGNLDSEDIYDLVMDLCDFIIGFEGEIPGAAPEQCGNYQEQNLDMAKYYIRKYRDSLKKDRNLVYPE